MSEKEKEVVHTLVFNNLQRTLLQEALILFIASQKRSLVKVRNPLIREAMQGDLRDLELLRSKL